MKQSEILASQLNADDPTKSNSTLVSRQQWEQSPLTICSIEEGSKWFLALGTKRLTKYYEYQHEVEEVLNQKSWELIIQIMVAVAEDTFNYINTQQKFTDLSKKSADNLANFNQHQAEKHGIKLNSGL